MQIPRILIVEDDELLRELYKDILTQEGYVIETAEDGQKGYEKIKQGGWDVILLDIILPTMNGLEIMKQLKSDPPLSPNKAVIFLTNLYEDAQQKEALMLGETYLAKSKLTPGDIVREIKTALAKNSHPTASE